MPDGNETRNQQIEKRIDTKISGAIALSGAGGALSVAPQNMAEMMEFAKMMAVSGPCVRPQFRGNPGACLAIALQAFRTGADPFAVANKAYITTSRTGDEQIAYEAQYIHAVMNNSGKLAQRLRPTYSGEGQNRKCTIIGYVVGEEEPLPYESPTVGEIAIKNSPLWKSDPDQQLFYYSTRAWGRRHLPEVLLGMYTPDEIRGDVIDITPGTITEQTTDRVIPPRPRREEFPDETTKSEPTFSVVDSVGEVQEFPTAGQARDALLEMLNKARSKAELDGVWESNEATIVAIAEALDDENGSYPLHAAYNDALTSFEPKKEQPVSVGSPAPMATGVAAPDDQMQNGDKASHSGRLSSGAATTTPRPKDNDKVAAVAAAHAERDARWWTQINHDLPGSTSIEIRHWAEHYIKQCRDQIDINGIIEDNANGQFKKLSSGDRLVVEKLIAQRRKELPQ